MHTPPLYQTFDSEISASTREELERLSQSNGLSVAGQIHQLLMWEYRRPLAVTVEGNRCRVGAGIGSMEEYDQLLDAMENVLGPITSEDEATGSELPLSESAVA